MIKINDIKPIVEIPDLSIYLYYLLIFLSFVCVLVLLYLLFKFLRPKKKHKDKRIQYIKKLQSIDFSQSKQSSYSIVKYGSLLAKSEESLVLLEELREDLLQYKYKKDVPSSISKEIQVKVNLFMESISVR